MQIIFDNQKEKQQASLFYQQIGQGEDLVLLHGWGTHSGFWLPLLPALAARYRITIIDLPGYGQSYFDPLTTHDLSMLANAILKVIPEKAMWLGWSMGGLIATYMAAHYPNRVSKLILVASSPRFTMTQDWLGLKPSFLRRIQTSLSSNLPNEKLARVLMFQFRNSTFYAANQPAILQTLFRHSTPHIEALRTGLALIADCDLREDLASIDCPVYYILGKDDALIPHAISQAIRENIKRGNVIVLENACHAPFLSATTAFLEVLFKVLAG